jgi:hypothetical protein
MRFRETPEPERIQNVMTGIAMNAVRPIVRLTSVAGATLLLGLSLACSSGPQPESSGIPGFEPTMKTVAIGPTDHFSVLDSNDVIVASRDRSLLGGIFLLLDDAQLPYRRYFQALPPRTAVGLIVQPPDSAAMDSVIRNSKAHVVVWEHVNIPRDREGNPLPIARFLVASVRNKVARSWVLGTDTAAGPQPLQDWIVAGVTQLVTGFPNSRNRNAQLASQLGDLVPIDSLVHLPIAETSVPSGVASDGTFGGGEQGRVDSRGRPVQGPPPRKQPRETLAALESASLIEFMWAREGRGIIKQLVDRTRRGEPITAVIANAVSLPHDVAGLEAAWKASLTPPKPPKK